MRVTRFDHAAIAVPDLDTAIEAYRGLGFDVSFGGKHTGRGTHNAIIRFGLDYLELLGIYDRDLAIEHGSGELIEFLDRTGGGLIGFALATGSQLGVITDSLTFLGESFNGPSAKAGALLELMDELHIDRAIVCPFKPSHYDLRRANDAIAESTRTHSDRFIGFGRLDPWQREAAIAEVDRCVGELGLKGIFLHPWEETFPIAGPEADLIAAAAGRHGIPVIVAAGYPLLSEGLQIGALASRHPTVSFVATNGCQLNISGLGTYDADFALARNPNLAVQTTGVYRQDFLDEVVAKHGTDRVLFASGYPLFDPRFEILRVSRSAFGDAERKAIYDQNAERRIFNWPG